MNDKPVPGHQFLQENLSNLKMCFLLFVAEHTTVCVFILFLFLLNMPIVLLEPQWLKQFGRDNPIMGVLIYVDDQGHVMKTSFLLNLYSKFQIRLNITVLVQDWSQTCDT